MSDKIYLVTHNGLFHADDVLSTVVLMESLSDNVLEIIRTNDIYDLIPEFDTNLIYNRYGDDHAIAYDIGLGRFDHHQLIAPVRESTGARYGTFGLVWAAFGKKYLLERFPKLTKLNLTQLHINIERTFVSYIDSFFYHTQCPSRVASLCNIIKWMNPIDPTIPNDKYMSYFNDAVACADTIFEAECRQQLLRIKSVAPIQDAVNRAVSEKKQYLVFDQYIDSDILGSDVDDNLGVLFAIYPSPTSDEWVVTAIPKRQAYHGYKCLIPIGLRGRARDKLMKYNWTSVDISGVSGTALTKQDAIRLAKYSIDSVGQVDNE